MSIFYHATLYYIQAASVYNKNQLEMWQIVDSMVNTQPQHNAIRWILPFVNPLHSY